MNKLKNHRGRFVTVNVNRARQKSPSSYCAKIISITDKTVRFFSVNENRERTVPIANIV